MSLLQDTEFVASLLPQEPVAPGTQIQPENNTVSEAAPVVPSTETQTAPVVETTPVVETPAAPVPVTPPAETTAPVDTEVTTTNTEPETWYTNETINPVSNPEGQPTVEVDPILNDEQVKFFIAQRKAGKNLADLVSELSVTDYSKLTDEQIIRQGIQEDFPDQEQFDDALATYEAQDVFGKRRLVQEYRSRFNQRAEERQKLLLKPVEDQARLAAEVTGRFNSELETLSQTMTGKSYKGFTITADIANDLKDFVANQFSLTREDGSPDVEKMFDLALWQKYGASLVKANVSAAKNQGREEILQQVSNPSPVPTAQNVVNTGEGDLDNALKIFSAPRP